MTDFDPYALAEKASTVLADKTGIAEHHIALVLGSGWASAIDEIGEISAEVEMATLPGFPEPTVLGHRNLIRSLKVREKNVLVLGGRAHLYEGHPVDTVVHGVRVAVASGCKTIILTNAAGGLNPEWSVGQPVLISDQLNLMGQSPMVGPAPPEGKAIRFVDLTEAYSARLRELAQEVDPTLPQGIYAGLLGGAFETPAEIRMFAKMGADLVGMSTVLETIAARHLGTEVLGISLVTNQAAGMSEENLDHEDVLNAAEAAGPRMFSLLAGILERL
ncbi:MAG: purine-nucleoside phosphorylase [Acidimicrobiales bacterium]|jgi:purine-nucleoside phosphorylase|nr:purine-nucleoside phosphorylase [Acidimicrobiales bacterium]